MAPTDADLEIAAREAKYLDTCQGCLVGGAAGDALGYAVEFWPREEILHEYGPAGITEYELDPASGLALFSDDTQMTLFTGMGYLVGLTRFRLRGIGEPNGHIRNAYLDWLRTQERPYRDDVKGPWLVHVPGLYSLRAPGNTCLSALRAGGYGTVDDPINNSKGCGGVMRVAPLGLAQEIGSPMQVAADAAAMTHGHPFGYMPAAALAYIVNRCMRDKESANDPHEYLAAVVRDCARELPSWFSERLRAYAEELGDLLLRAVQLAQGAGDDASCIAELGEGWVGEEAIAIAAFCAVRHAGSFDDAIISAVNHSGDSDSTGAICGNIVGALLGLKAIGPKWTEHLEMVDVIMELARDLCDGCPMEEFGSYNDETWLSKYSLPF